jgi:hypothetical protein
MVGFPDVTDSVVTEYDTLIPYEPAWILPYIAVYFLPVYFFAYHQFFAAHLDMGKVRRGWISQMVLILVGYTIFILLPVRIDSFAGFERHGGWLDTLSYQFVHKGMTKFCAFPSMHVASSWGSYWLYKSQNFPKIAQYITLCLALLQFPATLFTRAHFLLDLPAGFAVAFLVSTFFSTPLERSQLWTTVSSKAQQGEAGPGGLGAVDLLKMGLFVGFPVLGVLGLQYLEELTGWGGLNSFFEE